MPPSRQQLQILNPFHAQAGSEWSAYSLKQSDGSGADIRCWTPGNRPHAYWRERGVTRLKLHRSLGVRGSNWLQVGPWFTVPDWLGVLRPQRAMVLVNTADDIGGAVRAWRKVIGRDPELIFQSRLFRDMLGKDGPIHPSPIDIQRFRPRVQTPGAEDRFVVGRLSRDETNKHHFLDDPQLYRAVTQRGGRVRVMGGTCLKPAMGDAPGVELMSAGQEQPEAFLQSLDCFFYRTGAWLESFGRVVLEAMACGLPVVVHRYGGYAEYIDHGVDGFVFDTQAEAMDIMAQLQRDPALRQRIGATARAKLERLYSPEAMRERLAYYLR